jgi:hypothetical protein
MGDYIYVSAVKGPIWVAWADARDIVAGIPSIFLPFLPCNFGDPIVPGVPPFNDACYSQGGMDWNIYAKRI